ncbi:LytTR family DNA-binding domain-containing protein [Chitinophaga pendula]|uniref:LytR/AlgR family response regulator transcription factor n=1 Tax=Chitinophaga TaxID=79328 RepID=UPI000BAF18ED|nr:MULTISPECIES: LytTR family DNA-binding domain-containing protein [Chitinophaga]ASZ11857.1 DNA-binding response regulator [Chitinophaga sp. MD30]UCJ05118.1 LytTR family DNA-binding domain-containing protein [Chitinophaga pendula]
MLTAIAIDDELVALSVIKNHAAFTPFLEVKEYFTNAFEALDFLQKEKVDLIFLDIKMPDISGMEFVSSLVDPPMIIFTTAYSEHAVQSFELDAVDYLLKPFSLQRFLKACNKANQLQQLKKKAQQEIPATPEYIFIKSGYEQLKVALDDILYLESAGNYVSFVLKQRNILSRLSMQEALTLLPASSFSRVHRSFIVANNKIEKADRYAIYIGDATISIGAAYAAIVERLLKGDTNSY